MFWIIVIAIIVIIWIVKGNGLLAAKTRNSIHSWATGDEGLCCECKHCRIDSAHQYSRTGYFCALSKCQNITESTRMGCFEKPKVTDDDINTLFANADIWTEFGKSYIRQSLVGRAMTWTEIDEFLKKIPREHPEYIDQKKVADR